MSLCPPATKQLIRRQLNIPENRSQKTGANDFPGMYGHCSYPSVRMPEEDVTASGSYNFKSDFFEKTYEFLALQSGKASHTEIC
jgi:hypothetical protein